MSRDSDDSEIKRKGYHHGNLREALVRAVIELIPDKGPQSFTLAEAARAAGVSPAAPYRHYRDRDDLMADVAKRGFLRFEEALRSAWNEGRPKPVAALNRVGAAYLEFAARQPAYYAAMFEAGLDAARYPELKVEADRAFAVLRTAAEALVVGLPKAERPPVLMVALHIWALSHGIATLFARADPARRPIPMAANELLEAGVMVYLQGLGIKG